MPKDKPPKPAIPSIQRRPPAIGSCVKVWFDKASKDLLVASETGAITRDIYGICLEDVVFDTETTARGAVRCFATNSRTKFGSSVSFSTSAARTIGTIIFG